MSKTIIKLVCVVLVMITLGGLATLSISAAKDPNRELLRGKRVGFFGDSICAAGVDGKIGWAGRAGDANRMIWENKGQSGWAVSNCRGEDKTIFRQVFEASDSEYDMIILHGGTNDAWESAPIGSMSDKKLSYRQYSTSTFAGGMEKMFAYLREYRPDAIIGYIINFKFLNASVSSLNNMQEYVEMTKQICDKWEIPYLDLYSNDELTAKLHPKDLSGKYQTSYLHDFVHPSSAGYEILSPYVSDFLVKLITPQSDTEETAVDTTEINTDDSTDGKTALNTEEDSKTNNESGCGASLSCVAICLFSVALSGMLLCIHKKNRRQE